ncbi:hypothetical protein V5O48_011425 [Marasmius crinis-equi]|uniref:Uncharacterized protein n=1 Tax=Marasmius crinis-equi TaxID=585013 RepID=A0ABR3F5R3_9AGAR
MTAAPPSPATTPSPSSFKHPTLLSKDELGLYVPGIPSNIACTHCDAAPDVFVMSSDGTLLGAHFRDLINYTGALGWYADFHIQQGLCVMNVPDVTGDVLDLLLSFTHPYFTKTEIQSPLRKLPFEKLVVFAYAAEKYQVWLGVHMAKWLVEDYVQHYPIQTYYYYVSHYRDFDPRYPVLPRAISRIPEERMDEIKLQNFSMWCFWKDLREFGSTQS